MRTVHVVELPLTYINMSETCLTSLHWRWILVEFQGGGDSCDPLYGAWHFVLLFTHDHFRPKILCIFI